MVWARATGVCPGFEKNVRELNLTVTGVGGKHSNMLRREPVHTLLDTLQSKAYFTQKLLRRIDDVEGARSSLKTFVLSILTISVYCSSQIGINTFCI